MYFVIDLINNCNTHRLLSMSKLQHEYSDTILLLKNPRIFFAQY